MFWFALACMASGLVLAWTLSSTLVLAVMSFQIVAVLFGLWMGGILGGGDALQWGVSALFLHQGAYLAAVIASTTRQNRTVADAPSLADKVDEDLRAMDGLVRKIATAAPAETAELDQLIAQMRRTLHDDEALERLQRDRKTG